MEFASRAWYYFLPILFDTLLDSAVMLSVRTAEAIGEDIADREQAEIQRETGCKTLIGSRCKQLGMCWQRRWRQHDPALRCRQFNSRFEKYWEARLA